jgi:hypothetical protein
MKSYQAKPKTLNTDNFDWYTLTQIRTKQKLFPVGTFTQDYPKCKINECMYDDIKPYKKVAITVLKFLIENSRIR